MSGSDDKDSRTEEASEQKLRKARTDGDTWSTREPGHMLAYLGILVIVALILPTYVPRFFAGLSGGLSQVGSVEVETLKDLWPMMRLWLLTSAGLFLPALGVFIVGSICAAVLSGPFVVALKRIKPKPSKLSPLSGFKRLFGPSSLIEFAKNLVKLIVIAFLMGYVLWQSLDVILPGAIMEPSSLPGLMAERVVQGLAWLLAVMIPIVIFDIFMKRKDWLKKQRMSRKDQKDEGKENEGDPMIRARRQEIGRRRIRQQMAKAVPGATLVVMNPTHYAVALRYERGVDVAPVCVAKGADLMALKIRDLAFDHDIPVLESPPLARALHKSAEIDLPIPEDHWAAVAELVGYVLDLRRRLRRKLPQGTHHLSR